MMKTPSNWLKNTLIQLRDLDLRERAIQVQILELLLDVERRKAYAELGFQGLFSFCVKALGYSEAQSYQRIQAMHAMRTVPEIKTKIESGAMNVTTVAQVQVMIRQDQVQVGIKRTVEERLELFNAFQGKSTREVKEQIAELRGERIRMKLHLELDDEGESLWRDVQAQAVHQTRGNDLLCLKMLMREWLTQKNRAPKARTKQLPPQIRESLTDPRRSISGSLKLGTAAAPALNVETKVETKAVSIQTRREVLLRAHQECQNCGSKFALQLDHIQPRAKRGSNAVHNLRILCRNCNLHFAVKEFGLEAVKR